MKIKYLLIVIVILVAGVACKKNESSNIASKFYIANNTLNQLNISFVNDQTFRDTVRFSFGSNPLDTTLTFTMLSLPLYDALTDIDSYKYAEIHILNTGETKIEKIGGLLKRSSYRLLKDKTTKENGKILHHYLFVLNQDYLNSLPKK